MSHHQHVHIDLGRYYTGSQIEAAVEAAAVRLGLRFHSEYPDGVHLVGASSSRTADHLLVVPGPDMYHLALTAAYRELVVLHYAWSVLVQVPSAGTSDQAILNRLRSFVETMSQEL